MKKILKNFSLFTILPATAIFFYGWQQPANNTYSNKEGINVNQKDTIPKKNYKQSDFNTDDFNKAMEKLDANLADLDVQLKNLNINLDKQIKASLSKINLEEIQKQTEASLKQIDWNKIQNQVDNSLQMAKNEIAEIDFTKIQNDMNNMQEKLKSEEFKSQFNADKLNKEIDEATSKAKQSIEKAKQQLQHMKDFTNELAADGLIDKRKGYTIQWKNGNLFINGKEQPKTISDKYRKYENEGEIKTQPDDAEHF